MGDEYSCTLLHPRSGWFPIHIISLIFLLYFTSLIPCRPNRNWQSSLLIVLSLLSSRFNDSWLHDIPFLFMGFHAMMNYWAFPINSTFIPVILLLRLLSYYLQLLSLVHKYSHLLYCSIKGVQTVVVRLKSKINLAGLITPFAQSSPLQRLW